KRCEKREHKDKERHFACEGRQHHGSTLLWGNLDGKAPASVGRESRRRNRRKELPQESRPHPACRARNAALPVPVSFDLSPQARSPKSFAYSCERGINMPA